MYRALRRAVVAVLVGALAAILIAIIRMTPAAALQSIFTTAGEQTFVVPAGVSSLQIMLIGAPGANGEVLAAVLRPAALERTDHR